MDTSRRKFISGLLATPVLSAFSNLTFGSINSSKEVNKRKFFIWITLRGGMDGLNVVVPSNEPSYYKYRPNIAIKKSELYPLSNQFGLHPALKHCAQLYKEKQLLLAHAFATSYRQRSHFDAQKVLENGSNNARFQEGWINRLLQLDTSSQSIAIDGGLPLIVTGPAETQSWYPNKLKEKDHQANILKELFENDPVLSQNLEQALQVESMSDAKSQQKNFKSLCKHAARFLRQDKGPNIAVLELGGWDTHANQGAQNGRLANKLTQLDRGINQIRMALGEHWKQTVLVAASEFGRTIKENGTKGTDHGTGNAFFISGGAVNGGRVITDWPGISEEQLLQHRDLKPTGDLTALIKGILQDHLSLSSQKLDLIFPDSKMLTPIPNLIA